MKRLYYRKSLLEGLLFIIFLISLPNTGLSQNPAITWAENMAGSIEVSTIKTDISGNIYIMGYFTETMDFDPGPGVANLTATTNYLCTFAAKYDASGNFIWVRNIQINDVNTPLPTFNADANGNVYICGSFSGITDLNPNSGVSNVTSVGGEDIFLVKLTTTGAYAWGFTIGTAGYDRYPRVVVDGSGNVFFSANIPGSTVDLDPSAATANVTGSGAFLAKYSSAGAYVWGKRIGGFRAAEMIVDGSGNICMVGDFDGTADFDPSAAVANLTAIGTTYFDVFIAKYSSVGNYVWAKAINGDSSDEARALAMDNSGNLIISARVIGTVDLDPSSAVFSVSTASFDYDMIFAKYDALGNFLWGNSIGAGSSLDDDIYSIKTDVSSNIYISGSFQGTCDFDLSSAINNISSPNRSGFWAKYSNSGGLIWFNKLSGGTSAIKSMEVNQAGNMILTTGTHRNTVDMDPSSGIYNLVGPASPYEAAFIGKYATNCSNTSSTITQTACTNFTLNGQTYTANGTYTQTLTNSAGCDSTITLNLTISDLVAPVANLSSLANITSQCSVTSLTAPTATDNCAGTITGTHNATLPITTPGTTIVTWTYNDGHGNTSTQTQNVIINDNTAPVANTASLANITDQCSVTSLTAPIATDNCAGIITGTHNATLPITTSGTTVVTWTYNDGHGNTSTQTQNVIINDNTAPLANTVSLANITDQCSVTSLTAPTATDNCAGTITGTYNATLPITTPGTTIVTWTYNDGHGNMSTQTQNVIINDNTAPVANTANLPNVNGNCSVTSITAPTATDNCAGTITGTTTTTFPITAPGTTVVTWAYNDGHGNLITQTQNVIVTLPIATTTLSGLMISATTSGATYQWINCGNGNTPISGATSQSFTASANGTYAVIVTQNGCSSTSACVTISTVGLEEIDQLVFTVYPNPNNGMFIVVAQFEGIIEIRNAAGQLISTERLKAGENAIELAHAESGMYFISVADLNGQVFMQRVNINK